MSETKKTTVVQGKAIEVRKEAGAHFMTVQLASYGNPYSVTRAGSLLEVDVDVAPRGSFDRVAKDASAPLLALLDEAMCAIDEKSLKYLATLSQRIEATLLNHPHFCADRKATILAANEAEKESAA